MSEESAEELPDDGISFPPTPSTWPHYRSPLPAHWDGQNYLQLPTTGIAGLTSTSLTTCDSDVFSDAVTNPSSSSSEQPHHRRQARGGSFSSGWTPGGSDHSGKSPGSGGKSSSGFFFGKRLASMSGAWKRILNHRSMAIFPPVAIISPPTPVHSFTRSSSVPPKEGPRELETELLSSSESSLDSDSTDGRSESKSGLKKHLPRSISLSSLSQRASSRRASKASSMSYGNLGKKPQSSSSGRLTSRPADDPEEVVEEIIRARQANTLNSSLRRRGAVASMELDKVTLRQMSTSRRHPHSESYSCRVDPLHRNIYEYRLFRKFCSSQSRLQKTSVASQDSSTTASCCGSNPSTGTDSNFVPSLSQPTSATNNATTSSASSVANPQQVPLPQPPTTSPITTTTSSSSPQEANQTPLVSSTQTTRERHLLQPHTSQQHSVPSSSLSSSSAVTSSSVPIVPPRRSRHLDGQPVDRQASPRRRDRSAGLLLQKKRNRPSEELLSSSPILRHRHPLYSPEINDMQPVMSTKKRNSISTAVTAMTSPPEMKEEMSRLRVNSMHSARREAAKSMGNVATRTISPESEPLETGKSSASRRIASSNIALQRPVANSHTKILTFSTTTQLHDPTITATPSITIPQEHDDDHNKVEEQSLAYFVNSQSSLAGWQPHSLPTNSSVMREEVEGGAEDKLASKLADFKPTGKNITCPVFMLDGREATFTIDEASLCLHLFAAICDDLNLAERDYFGVAYQDSSHTLYWLDLERKVVKHLRSKVLQLREYEANLQKLKKTEFLGLVSVEKRHRLEFRVKFYPFDVENLIENLTRYFLCLQLRRDIASGTLRCSFHSYVILGAYVVQSEAGDYDSTRHIGIDYIKHHHFAPADKQTPEMLERISHLHRQLRGLHPEEADRKFLQNAKKLALYGVYMHRVTDSNGTDLQIGVSHSGLLTYRGYVRLRHISWLRLLRLSYHNREFHVTIRGSESSGSVARAIGGAGGSSDSQLSSNTLIYKCRSSKLSRRLYHACTEHHFFFRLRSQECSSHHLLDSSRYQSVDMKTSLDIESVAPLPRTVHSKGLLGRPQPLISRSRTHIVASTAAEDKQHSNKESKLSLLTLQESSTAAVTKPRPTFAPVHWALAWPDSTYGLVLDDSGLDASAQTGVGWQGARTNRGLFGTGRFYFETVVMETGPVVVGWTVAGATFEPVGSDAQGWGFGFLPGSSRQSRRCVILCEGSICQVKLQADEAEVSLSAGDTIGCLLVRVDPKMSSESGSSVMWTLNGRPVETAPGSISLPIAVPLETVIYPSVSMSNNHVTVNFGDAKFHWQPVVSATPMSLAPDTNMASNPIPSWRLNLHDATQGLLFAPDLLGVQSELHSGWQGCRSNFGVCRGGKYYYEIVNLEEGPRCWLRVGWSTQEASLELGVDIWGFGYGADPEGFGITGEQGKKMNGNEINNYGEAIHQDDTVGVFLDLTVGILQWSKNGVIFGEAFQLHEELVRRSAFFAAICLHNASVVVNFGERPFKYMPKDRKYLPLAAVPPECLCTSTILKQDGATKSDGVSLTSTEREEEELTGLLRLSDPVHSNQWNVSADDEDHPNSSLLSPNNTPLSRRGVSVSVINPTSAEGDLYAAASSRYSVIQTPASQKKLRGPVSKYNSSNRISGAGSGRMESNV